MMIRIIFFVLLAISQAWPAAASSTNQPVAAMALFQAVKLNDLDAAKVSLLAGLPVDTRNDQGRTPLIVAVSTGNLEMAKLLVEHGADVNAHTTTDTGSTVLCFAIDGGNLHVLDYLVERGAKVDGKSKNGQTPLHYAAAHGLNDFVRGLLKHGADPDLFGIPDTKGNLTTPLMAAAANGHLETVQLLVEKGAQLEKVNDVGDTVLMDVCKRPYPEIVKLLLEKGANVNASGYLGYTALIYAASQGRLETIKLLLTAGADPLATATEDQSPTATAVRYDAADMAEQNGHLEALLLVLQAQKQALRARRASQWDLLL
jgi:ankyrin repeat protein